MLELEIKAKSDGFQYIIGIDEAGRGPLAGPVAAAAVALKQTKFNSTIKDSKTLSEKKREQAFTEIYDNAYVGVGIISEALIDEVNILQATYLAMNEAVEQCLHHIRSDTGLEVFDDDVLLLVDGNSFQSQLPFAFQTVVKGDSKVLSIAAASIVAKVTRDRILNIYDQVYPQYGFAKHKGYGTKAHRAAIAEHGPTHIHRTSFTLK